MAKIPPLKEARRRTALSTIDEELVADARREYIEQMQRMHNKVDVLEAQVRKMTNDPPTERLKTLLRVRRRGALRARAGLP